MIFADNLKLEIAIRMEGIYNGYKIKNLHDFLPDPSHVC
jgi:hypothetical protein